jgi:hypothetical protein
LVNYGKVITHGLVFIGGPFKDEVLL